jgi:metal-responsive CopG/Arc/MetJ family transcriptional regulator
MIHSMERIQLLLPKQLRDRLTKAIEETGLSASEIIRTALSAYLKGLGQ